ncbi:hypothetical protein [Streptomyces sp. Tu 3180]|uniref:hypothetical protein n=1 Tax=Streptomyces sp. Tu 3180 TaxID=2682611 RepID=UPI001356B524|nr:hypothetical protein [Streptomyces sp. Tu 3180]KAF3469277.1 hypothetical protein GL259_36760 [Streptomyces sp. Tu 3180]
MPRQHRPSPPESPLPSVTLRGYGGTLWLEGRAVILEQEGLRRRIPVEAVAEARAAGRGQRSAEIALWGVDGAPGPVFTLEGRDAAQAGRLVETVNRARSRSGPPQGGAALVEERPTGTSGRKKGLGLTRRERVVGIALLLVHVGGFALLAWAGEPQQAALWLLGAAPALFGLLIVVPSLRWAWKRWGVRRRGVTVVAVFARREGKRTFFRYTDLEGGTHEIEPDCAARRIGGDPRRIEVVHDRRQPGRAVCSLAVSTLLWRTAGVTLAGGLLLSLAFVMMPLQLILLALSR